MSLVLKAGIVVAMVAVGVLIGAVDRDDLRRGVMLVRERVAGRRRPPVANGAV